MQLQRQLRQRSGARRAPLHSINCSRSSSVPTRIRQGDIFSYIPDPRLFSSPIQNNNFGVFEKALTEFLACIGITLINTSPELSDLIHPVTLRSRNYYNLYFLFLSFFLFLAMLGSLQDLSSPTRDRTQALPNLHFQCEETEASRNQITCQRSFS